MSFHVKNTTIPSPLDLIAPHICRGCGQLGEPLCECCKNHIIKNHNNFCPNCKKSNKSGRCRSCKAFPPIFVVGSRNDLIGKLIHDYKYNSVRALARPLAELICASLPENLNNPVIIPLPTNSRHIRERGLDHTYLLAKKLARLRHGKVSRLLVRVKNTTQVGSDRTSRLSQASSAYCVNPKIPVDPSATYILLDDVWTTGATIKAATKKLQQAGAKNIAVAILAVSELK